MEEEKITAPKVFFGVEQKEKYYLPETNNEQWIEVKKMKAAKKSEYFNSIGEMSKVNKRDDGKLDFIPDPTKIGMLNRKLIDLSVVSYNVYMLDEKSEPKLETGFDINVWNKLYETMDEEIENGLIGLIYKLNPSLGTSSEKKNK
jgi:hypothetical protein